MGTKKITKIFTWVTVGLIIIYDVYAIVTSGVDASISHYLYDVSSVYPIVPFAAGVVIGHLFWPNKIALRGKR